MTERASRDQWQQKLLMQPEETATSAAAEAATSAGSRGVEKKSCKEMRAYSQIHTYWPSAADKDKGVLLVPLHHSPPLPIPTITSTPSTHFPSDSSSSSHSLVNNKLMSLGGVDAYALLLYFAAIHTMTPHATTKGTKTAASAGSGNKQYAKGDPHTRTHTHTHAERQN